MDRFILFIMSVVTLWQLSHSQIIFRIQSNYGGGEKFVFSMDYGAEIFHNHSVWDGFVCPLHWWLYSSFFIKTKNLQAWSLSPFSLDSFTFPWGLKWYLYPQPLMVLSVCLTLGIIVSKVTWESSSQPNSHLTAIKHSILCAEIDHSVKFVFLHCTMN